MGSVLSTINYTYGDSSWGDLLTGWNGKSFSYDTIGNLTSDGTWSYTWEHGRELASMSGGGTTWNFTYNADGLRTKRTNSSTTYSYVYNGSSLSQMTVGSNTLYFAYDASGTPLSVTYNGTNYYYATNLQGDVTIILNASGTAVVQYTYDAWGKLLTTTGSMASDLGTHNPLRYRGYVYDTETGLYYLQSRYYNPEIGRFINADAFASTGQGLLGNNMFAYCKNNPINYDDASGNACEASRPNELKHSLGDLLLSATVIGGAFMAASIASSDEDTKAAALGLKDDSSERIYTVYFLYAEGKSSNEIVYVGRVKTNGYEARMRYHATQGRLEKWRIDGLTWAECRGLEQVGMAFFHTINRDSAINNQIRGVSATNTSRILYFTAAKLFWGMVSDEYNSFMPLSYWENWTENEFLNGGT